MKKFTQVLIILVITLSFVFTACGHSAGSTTPIYQMDNSYPGQQSSALADAGVEMFSAATDSAGSASNSVTMPADDRKIILNASIDMETQTFSDTCTALEKAVNDAGGYISSTAAYELGTQNERSAEYTFRIPSDKYSSFISEISTSGAVTRKTENTDDITSQYVDVEARLKSLRLQEERLYAMMEQAGELETLLAIQNQLTDVQYQIESYTSQQNTYDDLISYATVSVYVQEVNRVTEQPVTFTQRIAAAFSSSWYNFGEWCKDFAVGFVYALPTLIVLAVLAFIVIRIALSIHNKNVTKRQAAAAVMSAEAAAHQPASYQSLYSQPAVIKPTSSEPAPQNGSEPKTGE